MNDRQEVTKVERQADTPALLPRVDVFEDGAGITLLGFVPIATALVGYCPLYHLLHIRERPAPR